MMMLSPHSTLMATVDKLKAAGPRDITELGRTQDELGALYAGADPIEGPWALDGGRGGGFPPG